VRSTDARLRSMLGRRKRSGQESASPAEMYRDLRSMAFEAAVSGVIPVHRDHPEVFGLVADIPAQGGYATIVALGDNSTSMYTSTGGGTIGAGERPAVAASTQQLLAVVQAHLDAFASADDGTLPEQGWVRLHVLTDQMPRRADVSEDAFWGKASDPLVPVIAAVQDVMSRMREITASS